MKSPEIRDDAEDNLFELTEDIQRLDGQLKIMLTLNSGTPHQTEKKQNFHHVPQNSPQRGLRMGVRAGERPLGAPITIRNRLRILRRIPTCRFHWNILVKC
jgi:hypothetical protein